MIQSNFEIIEKSKYLTKNDYFYSNRPESCNSTKKWIWKKSIQNIFLIKKINDIDVKKPFIKMIKFLILVSFEMI